MILYSEKLISSLSIYTTFIFLLLTRVDAFCHIEKLPSIGQRAPVAFHANRVPWPGTSLNAEKNDNKDPDQDKNLADRIDEFLDRPFINLEDENDSNWFTNLIKNDYDLAEALFTSAFLTVMVILSQELLRMQMYGENYIPFHSGGGGKLF